MFFVEQKIIGPKQSGKTSLVLDLLGHAHKAGAPVAYVLPTRELAARSAQRTEVPCVAWSDAVNHPNMSWLAVAVDDLQELPQLELESGLTTLRNTLKNLSESNGQPTHLILVELSPDANE